MAAVIAASVEEPPTINNSNKTSLEKIESFLNESAYNEALENSSNYNARLRIERRLRLPFIDTQTGVAQNHSSLFMDKKQRIPGLLPGQIYSYPRQRWRKKRRQYLSMNARAFARAADHLLDGTENDIHAIAQLENPVLQDNDSKDSQLLKDDVSKGRSGTDSPSTPGRKKGTGRGRKKSGHNFDPTPGDPDKPFACELCGARYKTRPGLTYHYRHSHKEGASDDNSRDSIAPTPSTQTGGAPSSMLPNSPSGLGQSNPVAVGVGPAPVGPPAAGAATAGGPPNLAGPMGETNSRSEGQVYQDSYVSFLNQTPGSLSRRGPRPPNSPGSQPQVPIPPAVLNQSPGQIPPILPPNFPPRPPSPQTDELQMPVLMPEKNFDIPLVPSVIEESLGSPGPSSVPDKKNSPNPYCDFCLGNSSENKKTGSQEELVSCCDCGRSGHPTCLQFTDNMKISVNTYRWQCIECKCCSACGNSDNDDQLLFCDDCDRGYHMFCLSPPLVNPPEGSWSCGVCVNKFHK
ncbi:unnamed protein product [Psylliodes chrysocephalus]|uniref:Zinc finger protein ubi-d4 n=1 Tax=Psylliodes chrysocephalus TaxID=3402493 RepID=A0A9P0D057_9CUCU|nr:unnamed protein product [Psylliodes chrysocephala]